jgi:hypothetical protein
VFAVLLIAVLYTALSMRSLVSTVQDCTTNRQGQCYKEGQARTGEAVGSLFWTSMYNTECARLYPDEHGPAFDKKLEACVAAKMKARQGN